MVKVVCGRCGVEVEAQRRTRKWCDDCKSRPGVGRPPTVRSCRVCGGAFTVPSPAPLSERSRAHCSDDCSRESARRSRRESKRRAKRGEPRKATGRKRTLTDEQRRLSESGSRTDRFFLRHPHRVRACEACGESRVIDLAHKTPRNGAWPSLANTRDEDVWILCPTCHRVLDSGIQTAAELGLV